MPINNETLVAAVGAATQPSPIQADLLAKLVGLLEKNSALTDLELRQRTEEEEKKLEQKESARKLQLEGAKAMARQAEAERANQSVCGHRNDNGRAVIGGQRDHHHNTHYICLRCGKHWLNPFSASNPNGLPDSLRPKEEFIGGPNQ